MNTETKPDTIQQYRELEKMLVSGVKKVNVIYNDGRKAQLRIFKSQNQDVCCFRKGSRKYGHYFPFSEVAKIIPVKSLKSDEEKWEDAWKKVLVKLQKSGLWDNIVKEIELALKIGYKKLNKAYDLYWQKDMLSNEWSHNIEVFKEKFPELICKDDKGVEHINTSILYNIAKQPKVKKMRFCKWNNDAILQGIKHAMDNKIPHHCSGRYIYDISFEYRPEKNMAWYSEEYKNCGNGYYYIALNATHALFMEKD
jgi:hypothetical protein